MNNSFFGKTCEDVRKHRDVRIVKDENKVKNLVARPQYIQHVIYDEDMQFNLTKQWFILTNLVMWACQF